MLVGAIAGATLLGTSVWSSSADASVGSLESSRPSGGSTFEQQYSAQRPAADDDPHARIDSPTAGQRVSGRVEIRGRATTPDPRQFDYYRIYVGYGVAATQLRPLGPPVTVPVENGVLATVDLSTANPGEGLIVLRVYARNGDTYETRRAVVVEPSPVPVPTFTAPTVVLPTVEAPERPADVSAPIPAPQLAPVGPGPAPAPAPIPAPPAPSGAPIPQLGPQLTDQLPGDPVRPDPITDDIEVRPPVPTPVPFVLIPSDTQP
jgi:hypothetical protein